MQWITTYLPVFLIVVISLIWFVHWQADNYRQTTLEELLSIEELAKGYRVIDNTELLTLIDAIREWIDMGDFAVDPELMDCYDRCRVIHIDSALHGAYTPEITDYGQALNYVRDLLAPYTKKYRP